MKIAQSILIIVSIAAFAIAQKPQESKLLAPGTPAPSFSLPTLSGDRMSLSIYCGETLSKPYVNKVRQTMILSFWATYCKPCQKEMPELISFANKHKTDNVVVLCVSIDKEGAAVVEPFVKEKNYTVQVLLDPYTKTAERYGVKSLPALFVIDTLGIIRYSSLGYDEKNPLEPKLESIIKAIKEGTKIKVADATGSFVPIQEVPAPSAAPSAASSAASEAKKAPSAVVTAKQKWSAIARVECGEQIDKVAMSIGATPAELHQWYTDLKKAALSLWGADSASH
jgi:cytochrome c biogenesis protein CcmG, thiol:disulfide interchange protein DsbE